jgi:phosphohistidine phosphatase
MILYFMRHASAGESLEDSQKDHKRALDDEGVQQCSMMGRILGELDIAIDGIISSPLKRSAQTASLVSSEMGFEGKVRLSDALHPDAEFSDFRTLIEGLQGCEAVLLVGHNPNLSDFLSMILGGPESDVYIDLRKASIARVELKRMRGTLQWYLPPKLVKAVYAAQTTSSRPSTSRK